MIGQKNSKDQTKTRRVFTRPPCLIYSMLLDRWLSVSLSLLVAQRLVGNYAIFAETQFERMAKMFCFLWTTFIFSLVSATISKNSSENQSNVLTKGCKTKCEGSYSQHTYPKVNLSHIFINHKEL